MYTTLTADDFRRTLKLPKDYSVSGLLACGVWDLYAEERHLPHFRKAVADLGVTCAIKRFEDGDLGHAFELTCNDKKYWYVPVMGTAMMAAYAHFASILGSKKNILMGVVGGLAPGIKPADFVLPTATLGNDNALKYQPEAKDKMFYPDQDLYQRLKRAIPADQKVWEGKTMTCESILAETAEDVQNWSGEGYLGVEMETALMFALSRFFHIPAAAILYVSENLIGGETLLHQSHEHTKPKREESRRIQYQAALRELLAS